MVTRRNAARTRMLKTLPFFGLIIVAVIIASITMAPTMGDPEDTSFPVYILIMPVVVVAAAYFRGVRAMQGGGLDELNKPLAEIMGRLNASGILCTLDVETARTGLLEFKGVQITLRPGFPVASAAVPGTVAVPGAVAPVPALAPPAASAGGGNGGANSGGSSGGAAIPTTLAAVAGGAPPGGAPALAGVSSYGAPAASLVVPVAAPPVRPAVAYPPPGGVPAGGPVPGYPAPGVATYPAPGVSTATPSQGYAL